MALGEVGQGRTLSRGGAIWHEEGKLPIFNSVIPASGKMGDANIVHASNPTFVVAPDGKYRIYYKSITGRASRGLWS